MNKAKAALLQDVIDGNTDTILITTTRSVSLMMAYFRADWERIISGGYDRTPEEMLRYRRSLRQGKS